MVLTVQTAEVAARTGQRQTRRTRMEVVERLLLYRVDGQCAGLSINLTDEDAVMVTSASAAPRLAVGNAAVVRTELAHHAPVVEPLIISALVCFHKAVLSDLLQR